MNVTYTPYENNDPFTLQKIKDYTVLTIQRLRYSWHKPDISENYYD